MKLTLTGANIVVLADSHNPSIASKDWLLSNGIFVEEPEKFMHSPVLALYESARFILTVDPQRLQVTLKQPKVEALKELPEIVKRYVERLPQTPYRAVGLNYAWHAAKEEGESPVHHLKSLFVGDARRLGLVTDGKEWTIGGILRWRADAFVVRLMVEPTAEPSEGISLDFNFHREVRGANEALEGIGMFESHGVDSREVATVFSGAKNDTAEDCGE